MEIIGRGDRKNGEYGDQGVRRGQEAERKAISGLEEGDSKYRSRGGRGTRTQA